jgi:hypothetical protein
VHIPLHAPFVQTNWHGIGAFTHMPAALHVWTVRPLHCVLLGAQAPPQTPMPLQTFGQGAPSFAQLPSFAHVCGWLPLHCLVPGLHVPPQAAVVALRFLQTNGQVCVSFQAPFMSQVRTVVFVALQLVDPGAHTPEQPPGPASLFSVQRKEQKTPGSHVPSVWHVKDLPLSHLVSPGKQMPTHAPPMQT